MRSHVERHLRKLYLELELSNSTSLLQTLRCCYNGVTAPLDPDVSGLSGHAATDSMNRVWLGCEAPVTLASQFQVPPYPESHLLS